MIIGISGKIGSGKDTVGRIINYLTAKQNNPDISYLDYCEALDLNDKYLGKFEIKKFAGKLKQIVSILTGISVSDLEKQKVKDRVLGEEWCRIVTTLPLESDVNKIIIERGYTNAFFEQTDTAFIVYQKMTVRQLLQEVGTDAMRNVIHPNIWVNALFADYKIQQGFGYTNDKNTECSIIEKGRYPNWIITDCRFPNELEAVKERKGISIRVNRLLSEGNRPYVELHSSETALDEATFDYVINNDGTIEELIEKVKQILIKEKII